MALLDMMRAQGFECVVAHVNYNKRSTSQRDQGLIETYCQKHQLRLEILQDHYQGGSNFQAHARQIRYDFFAKIVRESGAKGVMVGHHRDDDVETYLMQKTAKRTTNYRGIEPTTYWNDVMVVRPLLNQSKESLIAYCQNKGIEFGHDESNDLDVYTRNRVRHQLASMDAEARQQLEARMDEERHEHLQEKQTRLHMVNKLGDEVLTSQIADTQMLRMWLASRNVAIHAASDAYLVEMLRNFQKNKGEYAFGETIVYAQYGSIFIDQLAPTDDVFTSLVYGDFEQYRLCKEGKRIEGLHLTADDFPIHVRNPRPDDFIQLRFGKKKLNRYFIDAKIPRIKRKNWLVVANSKKDIVFVVGIGCDIHHYANISNIFVVK